MSIKTYNTPPPHEFLELIQLPDKDCKALNYLIVQPNVKNMFKGFPLGMAYVSSALKVSGRNVLTLNLNNVPEPTKFLKQLILENKVDVVLTGGTSLSFREIQSILNISKEADENITTVVGGVIITADPIPAMKALENIDYGIIGEAEITVNALAYALEMQDDASNVPGVICFRNNEWLCNDNYPIVHDLDILPYPDYIGFMSDSYSRPRDYVLIDTSRSCTHRCTFCYTNKSKYRQRALNSVFSMLDWFLSLYPNTSFVRIGEELIFNDSQYAIKFSRRIKPYKLNWWCSIRANTLSKEALAAMKDAGCSLVQIGIESASNKILKSMRKGVTIEQIEKTLNDADEVGLELEGNLIFGDIEETVETMQESLDWQKKYSTNICTMHTIRIFPGSQLYNFACENGFIKDRVQYLKELSPKNAISINISKLPNDIFFVLPALLNSSKFRSEFQDINIVLNNDYTLNISGRCPICLKKINFAKHENLINVPSKIQCPECNNIIGMNPIEHYCFDKLNENAKALISGSKTAIWATTPSNVYWLLEAMPILQSDNVFFVNSEKMESSWSDYIINSYKGKKFYTPDEVIDKERIDTIIVPNNPKVFASIKAECEAKYPTVKRVVHITDLTENRANKN